MRSGRFLCVLALLGSVILAAGLRAAPQQAPRPRPTAAKRAAPSPGAKITITFTGDVSMTWRALPKNLKRLPQKRNPLRFFAKHFKAADLAVANFEGVLAHDDPRYAEKRYNLWAPVASGQVFADAHVDVVSNANNHAFDGRDVGVLRTLSALQKTGVKVFGIGRTMAEAQAPYVFRRGRTCVAILPGTTKSNKGVRGQARVAYYPWKEWDRLLARVRQTARTVCPFVVVYLHWGTEKLHYPERKIKALGRQIIEAGASLLVGHHPHVLQGVEYHRGGAIVYSLGNFVFSNPNKNTRRTGLLSVELSPGPPTKLTRLELHPAFIHRGDYTPRPATRLQGEDILRRLRAFCAPFGTQVVMHHGRVRFLSPAEVAPPGSSP